MIEDRSPTLGEALAETRLLKPGLNPETSGQCGFLAKQSISHSAAYLPESCAVISAEELQLPSEKLKKMNRENPE